MSSPVSIAAAADPRAKRVRIDPNLPSDPYHGNSPSASQFVSAGPADAETFGDFRNRDKLEHLTLFVPHFPPT
jgi:hypothetical protein